MTSFDEGELQFEFGDDWHAEQFDRTGTRFPRGVLPVDFIVEGDDELVLVEIKDPSASRAPERNREQFVRKMKSKELTHQELVPKARTSYGFLHLMARDTKRMRYVVVIGTEHLSMQPVLLANLTDMLRARLARETETAWQRPYVSDCIVVSIADFSKAITGCSACRITPGAIGASAKGPRP